MSFFQKSKQKIKIVLSIIAIVLVIVVGGLYISFSNLNNDSASASILENQDFINATTEYSNTKFGFSVRYYNSWYASEYENTTAFYTDFDSISDSYVENLTIKVFDDFNLDEYLKSLSIKSQQAVQLGVISANKIESHSKFGVVPLQSVIYIFNKDNKTFVAEYIGQVGDGYDKYIAPAEMMIQSLTVK